MIRIEGIPIVAAALANAGNVEYKRSPAINKSSPVKFRKPLERNTGLPLEIEVKQRPPKQRKSTLQTIASAEARVLALLKSRRTKLAVKPTSAFCLRNPQRAMSVGGNTVLRDLD